jgi:predicted lipid-binding transport protein (Tim44 family)
MGALLAWFGKLLATVVGGPGIVVLGDPGLATERSLPSGIGLLLLALAGILVMTAVAGIPGAILYLIVLASVGVRLRIQPRTDRPTRGQPTSPASTASSNGSRPAK